MGVSEEVGKAAGAAIDALKTQPFFLVIILFNLIVLVMVFWAVQDGRKHQHEIMQTMLQQNAKALDLLARCVVPHNIGLGEPIPL
jgi:hypothetical protein